MVEKLQDFEETIDPIVQLFEDSEVQEYLEQKKYMYTCRSMCCHTPGLSVHVANS